MVADDPTEEEDLTLEAQDAGIAFRAEMWATDALMQYWMYVVGTLVVALGGVFFYGQYANYQVDQQRVYAKAVTLIENRLDGPVAQLAYFRASGQTLDDAELAEAGKAFEAVNASGAALCEALMKAAEVYRLAAKVDDQRRVLGEVVAEGLEPYAFLASSAIANLDLEAGENDKAIARLSDLIKQHSSYLGEQAAIDLGMVHEQLEHTAEARAVYEAFLEKWQKSPRRDLVEKRLTALGTG